jgi:hypothetical protein
LRHRRSDDDERRAVDELHLEAMSLRVGLLVFAEHEVEIVRAQIAQEGRRVAGVDRRHADVHGEERQEQRRRRHARQRAADPDAQGAGWFGVAREGAEQTFARPKHHGRVLEDQPTFGGEVQPGGRTLEQGHPERLLQGAELLADGRRANTEPARGSRHGPFDRDDVEVMKMVVINHPAGPALRWRQSFLQRLYQSSARTRAQLQSCSSAQGLQSLSVA